MSSHVNLNIFRVFLPHEAVANSDALRNPGNFLAIFGQVTNCYALLYE